MLRIRSRFCCAWACLLIVATGGLGCGDDDETTDDDGGNTNPDVTAGDTVIVAIVNPVVNDGHNTAVPSELGEDREGILVNADPGTEAATADGLATVDVPVEPISLAVGDAKLSVDVVAAGDVYDAPAAYSGGGAAFFDNTPIRYAVGTESGGVFFDPDDPLDEIRAKLEEDNQVIVLGPGTYTGDLQITGTDVVIFGEGFLEHSVIIDGSVTAEGTLVRLRGVTITGNLAAKGNEFGISFSIVKGTTSITGNGGAFIRNVFCQDAVVPSSNATLLDNEGVAPIPAPAMETICK